MSMTKEVEAAKAVIASHEQLCRDGDLVGVLINIADDVVLVVSNTPLVAGKEAFEEVYSNLAWADGTLNTIIRGQRLSAML